MRTQGCRVGEEDMTVRFNAVSKEQQDQEEQQGHNSAEDTEGTILS
jgi:hypothetical protein